jgi:hypothetical protein
MKTGEEALAKLLNALQGLSSEDLSALESLLRSPSARESFWRMLRELLHLRREAASHSLFDLPPGEKISPWSSVETGGSGTQDRAAALQGPQENWHQAFVRILSDKSSFPSTRDVVDELNRSFGLALPYERYRKRGRRELLQSAWTEVIHSRDRKKRATQLRTFFARSPDGIPGDVGYAELFRILTTNEPHAK